LLGYTQFKSLIFNRKFHFSLELWAAPCVDPVMKPTAPRRHIQLCVTLDALASPTCEKCRAFARFVGLESHPHNGNSDLCTYECDACGHVQTNVVARDGAANGDGRSNGASHRIQT
jgi:hypothetical protein